MSLILDFICLCKEHWKSLTSHHSWTLWLWLYSCNISFSKKLSLTTGCSSSHSISNHNHIVHLMYNIHIVRRIHLVFLTFILSYSDDQILDNTKRSCTTSFHKMLWMVCMNMQSCLWVTNILLSLPGAFLEFKLFEVVKEILGDGSGKINTFHCWDISEILYIGF